MAWIDDLVNLMPTDATPHEPTQQAWQHPTTNEQERFNLRVSKCGESECWEWTGAVDYMTGYGKLRWRNGTSSAHRVAWMIRHGQIADGLYVCHKCDNKRCVNTSHMFLGTHADNMADMVAKGINQPRQPFCRAGHDMAIHAIPHSSGTGRRCGKCLRQRQLESYHRLKQRA